MLTSRHAAYALVTVSWDACFSASSSPTHRSSGCSPISIFGRFDANHDGILSREEVRAARATMFDRIDTDHSGTATIAEIEAGKAHAQPRMTQRIARLAQLRAEGPTPSERFAAMDANHDGKITRDEFVDATIWFDRIAKNGGISKQDFAKFLDGTN